MFVASGVRYDLILKDTSGQYLKDLCQYHVGGQLKIAPEHISDRVLKLMHKPPQTEYRKFIEMFKKVNKQLGKDQYLVPYFISAHPGSELNDTIELAEFVRDNLQYYPEQVQNFTPTPMTISTCMYHTGIDPLNKRKVYIPRHTRERRWQRALLQYRDPRNRNLVREALQSCGRVDLINSSPQGLLARTEKNHGGNQTDRKQISAAGKKHGKAKEPLNAGRKNRKSNSGRGRSGPKG
jgi:radical SAM superfamily enzyme YgiQ (UPF0313 family)